MRLRRIAQLFSYQRHSVEDRLGGLDVEVLKALRWVTDAEVFEQIHRCVRSQDLTNLDPGARAAAVVVGDEVAPSDSADRTEPPPEGSRIQRQLTVDRERADDRADRCGRVDDDMGDVVGERTLAELDLLRSIEDLIRVARVDGHDRYTPNRERGPAQPSIRPRPEDGKPIGRKCRRLEPFATARH